MTIQARTAVLSRSAEKVEAAVTGRCSRGGLSAMGAMTGNVAESSEPQAGWEQ